MQYFHKNDTHFECNSVQANAINKKDFSTMTKKTPIKTGAIGLMVNYIYIVLCGM